MSIFPGDCFLLLYPQEFYSHEGGNLAGFCSPRHLRLGTVHFGGNYCTTWSEVGNVLVRGTSEASQSRANQTCDTTAFDCWTWLFWYCEELVWYRQGGTRVEGKVTFLHSSWNAKRANAHTMPSHGLGCDLSAFLSLWVMLHLHWEDIATGDRNRGTERKGPGALQKGQPRDYCSQSIRSGTSLCPRGRFPLWIIAYFHSNSFSFFVPQCWFLCSLFERSWTPRLPTPGSRLQSIDSQPSVPDSLLKGH